MKSSGHSAGLAHDALSTENAIAILQAERPPLILDPSGQASRWLQARLKARGANYEVVQMQSDRSAVADLPVNSFLSVPLYVLSTRYLVCM